MGASPVCAENPPGCVLSNADLSRDSCDCERRGASAQKLHNNPEFLPGSTERTANGRAITALPPSSPRNGFAVIARGVARLRGVSKDRPQAPACAAILLARGRAPQDDG